MVTFWACKSWKRQWSTKGWWNHWREAAGSCKKWIWNTSSMMDTTPSYVVNMCSKRVKSRHAQTKKLEKRFYQRGPFLNPSPLVTCSYWRIHQERMIYWRTARISSKSIRIKKFLVDLDRDEKRQRTRVWFRDVGAARLKRMLNLDANPDVQWNVRKIELTKFGTTEIEVKELFTELLIQVYPLPTLCWQKIIGE